MDLETLEKLKELCQIAATKEEQENLIQSLEKILEYVSQLKEISTEETIENYFVLGSMQKQGMREDVVKDILPREVFISNAPDHIGGMVKIPTVL